MYNFLVRNGQLLAFGLGTLLTVVFLLGVFSGLDSFNALGEEGQGTTNIFNFGLYAVAILAILCVAFLLLFGLYHTVTDLKSARTGLIGFAILLGLFFVARAMAPADVGQHIVDISRQFNVSDTASRNISGGIAFTLLLLAISGIAFVFSEIRNFFK